MRRYLAPAVLALSIAVALAGPPSASACSCAPPDEAAIATTDRAVIGEVVDVRDPSRIDRWLGADNQRVTVVRIEQTNVPSLDPGDDVEVHSGTGGGDYGLGFEQGDQAALLLGEVDDEWTGSICASLDPEELERLAPNLRTAGGSPWFIAMLGQLQLLVDRDRSEPPANHQSDVALPCASPDAAALRST